MIFELAKQAKNLSPLFAPYPPASDRKSWDALPADLKRRLIYGGEASLDCEYPVITATDYMDFTRTGDRNRYQHKLFKRRTMLNCLVLAECAEYKGRFTDAIINGIYAICGEAAWQLPAHNSYIRDTPQLILPDVTRPIVDLFAAETGAVLAMTRYLLGDALDTVSPMIGVMIGDNIDRRIITPYLTEHFWWMGDGKSHMNNWTVWCTQNVLLSAFVQPSNGQLTKERRSQLFYKACRSLDYFLEEYGNDGCCEEGAQYYHHAALCLFNSLEILNGITGGAFSPAYKTEKVKNIASYIFHVHVDGSYFVNFADCSPVAGRCNAREFLFGKRTESRELEAFAASDYQHSEDPLIQDEHNLFYRLQMVFTHSEMMEWDAEPELSHKDIYYPSTGLFIARDAQLFLAVKAGDNGDSHNHNDTGSFTVYKDGKPLFIDVGVETYTKKTFSPERYEIWTMQSQYHNLPSFKREQGLLVQKDGSSYRASDVDYELGESLCRISMDIAAAYPDKRVRKYIRNAVLKKGCGITITDHYEGEAGPAVLSLMTYEKPVLEGGILTIGQLGSCRITGASSIEIETVEITDERLKTAWEHEIYRCLVSMDKGDLCMEIPE